MWSFRAWRRRRLLARHPLDHQLWQQVLDSLPILDGLNDAERRLLGERCILFLHAKHLTALPGVQMDAFARLRLAAQAQLPLLNLPDLDWYQASMSWCCTRTTLSARRSTGTPAASNIYMKRRAVAKPGTAAR